MIVFQPASVPIKDSIFLSVSLFLMAELCPTRLEEYCKVLGISFFDVSLKCVFCNCKLSLQDLASFDSKCLSLIWKNNECFASCTLCLRLSARYEREKYTQCIVKGCMLETLTATPLCELIIRCKYCYRKLDYVEKIDCCVGDLPFSLVRSQWRNCCRLCRYENERA